MSAKKSASPGLHRNYENPPGSLRHPPPLRRAPLPFASVTSRWNRASAPWMSSSFFKSLPPCAVAEFQSLTQPLHCERHFRLLSEKHYTDSVLFLQRGEVRLFLHSAKGRRLTLGAARPGDFLGLSSAFCGAPARVTAVAQTPCLLASFPSMLFLDFLKRYPSAGQCVHQQLNQEFLDVCQQLRLLSLTTTAPRKVAGLFLAWSRQQAASLGVNRIRCTMTHEEIGEHIGVSRETVCRTLADLKERRMLEQRGSLFLITDISALQQQAGSENEEAGDYE